MEGHPLDHHPGKAFLETILQKIIPLKNYKAGPQKGSLFCLPDPLIFQGRLLPNFGVFFFAPHQLQVHLDMMFIEATGRDSLVFLQLWWLVVFGMFVRMHQNMLDLNPTQSQVANEGLFGFLPKL